MGSFDQNFQSIIGLRKTQLGLDSERLGLDKNQQQFNQNEAFFRRDGELQAQKIGNNRSQFELDRAKGFMPHDLRMAQLQGDAAHQNLYDQKQQSYFNADMNKYDLQGRGMDMADRSALAGRRQVDWAHDDKNRDYDLQGRGMDMADRLASRYGGSFGGGFGGLGTSGFSSPAIRASTSYSGYSPAKRAYANGGAVVSFSDLEPANVAGRKQTRGPGMKKYNENYAFGSGTGRARAPQDFRKAPRTLADGGPVQDVQAKGFVPVKVSNGEFEFTPEQVANIGAAMLASKEQVPA